MTRLFRSKSCGLPTFAVDSFFSHSDSDDAVADKQEEQEFDGEDDYGDEDDDYGGNYYYHYDRNPRITTPFISPDSVNRRRYQQGATTAAGQSNSNHFTVLTLLVAALRKSLVTCSVDTEDVSSTASSAASPPVDIQIGGPTDVKHLSHVTFDRFNGFLGLPLELQSDVPRKVPSASVSVFGVSAESMQCSYDQRGNSVPTILLMMQKHLYSGGGLQAEGVFRINAENSQEEHVRKQLNKGFVPQGIDVHCLAGLIKAWFRELPSGVLDSLTPEQVMHCNTEEECTQLVKSLPPTEAALLDWAINLMADVVSYEHENKMNARNIAMVFAPNMTQMADPLTALIHAVQVMNLLKTLIMKTVREREEGFVSSCGQDSRTSKADPSPLKSKNNATVSPEQTSSERNLLRSATLDRLESESEEKFWSFPRKSNIEVPEYEYASSGKSSPAVSSKKDLNAENGFKQVEVEGILERLSLRKGVRKLCRHPVFQLSKPVKKNQSSLGIVSTKGRGGEAWV